MKFAVDKSLASDAHHNGEVLGGYRESSSGIIIEVEE